MSIACVTRGAGETEPRSKLVARGRPKRFNRVVRFTSICPCVLLLLLPWAAGCPSTCPAIPIESPVQALESHRGLRTRARVLRAEASVEQFASEGRIRGTVLMFIQRPEQVRFDAMTDFGPAAILTSDGVRFALSDLRENQFLTGPTCPENIARLLGIPMSGRQVTLFLLGDSPRIEADDESIRCDGGRYLVELEGVDGRRQELEFEVDEADLEDSPDDQRLRLRRSEVFSPGGETEWRATFDDYEIVTNREEGVGVALPFRVRFEHPARDADTTVRFRDIDLNVEVPDGVFQQESPPGVTVQEVSCEAPSL